MRNKGFVIVALALALMLIFSSCSNYLNYADDFYGGDVIDDEELSRLAEEIFSSDESLRPDAPSYEGDTTTDGTEENDTDGVTDEPEPTEDETTAPNPEDLPPEDEETTEEVTTEREHDGVYYWTESGTKYHMWSDCGHLKNSTGIICGTLSEAKAAKDGGLCASCAQRADAPTDDGENTEIKHDGVYYWTESGTRYHMWSDCGHLNNSTKIFEGSLDDATEAGKTALCSSCAEKIK